MKKFIALFLVLAFALSIVACSSDSSSEDETETLVMATNAEFEPYEYYDGDEVVGIDVEIMTAIAEELGMTLKVSDMDFSSIIAAVTSGKADVGMAGMTITEDRLESVNFSDPYTTSTQVVIVNDDSDITSVADLEGKTIGVQTGTTGDIYASDEDEIPDATIDRYDSGTDAVQALLQGKVDAVIIDNEPAKVYVEANDGIYILDEEFVEEEYAIAVSKDNDELLEKINDALATLQESGEIQTIIDKYISADSDTE